MGYMKCPFCGQEIDSEAKKCFFCDSDLSHIYDHEEPVQVPEKIEVIKTEQATGLGKITLLLLLGAAFS